jgi:hypothetical protein
MGFSAEKAIICFATVDEAHRTQFEVILKIHFKKHAFAIWIVTGMSKILVDFKNGSHIYIVSKLKLSCIAKDDINILVGQKKITFWNRAFQRALTLFHLIFVPMGCARYTYRVPARHINVIIDIIEAYRAFGGVSKEETFYPSPCKIYSFDSMLMVCLIIWITNSETRVVVLV